jgi:hypothetical protein
LQLQEVALTIGPARMCETAVTKTRGRARERAVCACDVVWVLKGSDARRHPRPPRRRRRPPSDPRQEDPSADRASPWLAWRKTLEPRCVLALGPPVGNRTQNARVGADELSHQPIRGSGAHPGRGWCLGAQARLALDPPLGNRTQNTRVGADELSHQPIRGSGPQPQLGGADWRPTSDVRGASSSTTCKTPLAPATKTPFA